jgi:hypothetical protein
MDTQVKGVYNIKGIWIAKIMINKKRYTSSFKTKEEAETQRKSWEKGAKNM